MVSRNSAPTLETKVVGVIVIVVLVLAFVSLYFYPNNTTDFFAWTIKPATTAILIGEGYMAGALFFLRVITTRKWHTLQAGFLPITSFTVVMMGATLLHWDRFHQGTFLFYLWTVIYAVTPFLVPFLWWRNRTKDLRTAGDRDLFFSRPVRRALGVTGGLGILVALTAFIFPAFYIAITPWKLTELTARIFSGWTMLAAATLVSVAWVGRWSSTRLLLQSVLFGQVLTLLALPRIWADLNLSHPMSYVFVGGLIVWQIIAIVVYFWAERRAQ